MAINLPKNKFSKEAWSKIRVNMEGWRGEIHHMAGKSFEYLATLRPMSTEEHRGKECFYFRYLNFC